MSKIGIIGAGAIGAAFARVLFFSGNSAQAKVDVAALIERLGFFGVDLGSLSVGGRLVQFPGGPLPALNLVKFA